MSASLFDEYHDWFPGTKIELVNGQLIIGTSLTHSRRLGSVLHLLMIVITQLNQTRNG